jgi:hypothetical protein
LANRYAWFVRGPLHAAMCRASIESVLKADKDARCIVVTDEDRPSWAVQNAQLLHVEPGMPIMLANLEAQVLALSAAWTDGDEQITFLDTDTLLLKPIHWFGDVTFTWRDNVGIDDDGEKVEGVAARMPYNYGVVIARPGIRSFEAFVWMRERVRQMHDNHQLWYGNQLAAAELAGGRPKDENCGGVLTTRRIPWRLTNHGKELQIGKLPCARFNYTPQAIGEDVSDKYVLHFKGGKRPLMRLYAESLGLGWYIDESAAA